MNLGPWKGSVNNLISFDSFLLYTSQKGFHGLEVRTLQDAAELVGGGSGAQLPGDLKHLCQARAPCFTSLPLFFLPEEGEQRRQRQGKYTFPGIIRGILLCLHSLKPQLPHWRQFPNAGRMMECCFYSSDMSMLVPQSKIFMQRGLFAAFVWKEHRPYCFKGHLTKAVKGIILYFKPNFTFSEGQTYAFVCFKGKHKRTILN